MIYYPVRFEFIGQFLTDFYAFCADFCGTVMQVSKEGILDPQIPENINSEQDAKITQEFKDSLSDPPLGN